MTIIEPPAPAPTGMRGVLCASRISRDKESASLLERHRLELENDTERRPDEYMVKLVEDISVSGGADFTERKALKDYLEPPLVDTWQVLKVVNQARLIRDDLKWNEFIGWIIRTGKDIKVLDDPAFDITTPNGRMIAYIKAVQAAEYRLNIVKDRKKQVDYHRENDFWPGGVWPFGYRALRMEIPGFDRKRYKLIVDLVTSALVREAYNRIVNHGDKLLPIVQDWNKRGVLTSLDYQRKVNEDANRENVATKVRGTLWTVTALSKILKNPAIMGYAVDADGIRYKDGLPIQWAAPILSPDEFAKLQSVLESNGFKRTVRVGQNHMLGVLYCRCGCKMYNDTVERDYATYLYYVCGSNSKPNGIACDWQAKWPREMLDTFVAEEFLRMVGDAPVIKRSYVAGSDNKSDVSDLKTAIDRLVEQLVRTENELVRNRLTETMDDYAARLKEAENKPVIEGHWEEAPTGETYAQMWNRLDWKARGDILRKAGVRCYVGGKPDYPNLRLFVPEDIKRRASDVQDGTVDAEWVDEWAALVDQWVNESTE